MKIINSGSDRYFIIANKRNVILIDQSKDNLKRYVDLALFLNKKKVNVPKVYVYGSNFAIIRNLGNTIYQLFSNNPIKYNYNFLKECYYKVSKEITKVHKINLNKLKQLKFSFFDLKVLRWEWQYFIDNYLVGYLFSKNIRNWIYYSDIVINTCFNIFKFHKNLIHRDLQSTNILFYKSNIYFIDFQGMMIGNFLYDLASLVEDPYLSLPQMLKQKILDYYFSMNNWNLHLYYKYYKVQRLVQVLGAFAFLSIQKNKDFFIKQLKNSYPVLQDIILQLKNL